MTNPTGVLFSDPRVKPLSTSGLPQAACYAQFYLTGTTTPAAVYADGALTTPLTNPVTSDSAGRFVPVYLNPGTVYRVQVYSAADVLLSDTDPYVVPGIPSQAGIGQIFYPQSATEIAASITPTAYQYPYGAYRRYGMDPTSSDDSEPGFTAACACNAHVFDEYPGGGTYLFNSQPTLTAYPLRVSGQGINYGGLDAPRAGTAFQLSVAAGANAALIAYLSSAYGIVVEDLALLVQNNQNGMNFHEDFRASNIRNVYVQGGDGTSANETIAVLISGASGVTEAIDIEGLTTGNVQYGVYLAGVTTTVKIHHSELGGNTAAISGSGVFVANTVTGASVDHCLLEGFATAGIESQGSFVAQEANHFEQGSAPTFVWTRGSGNARIWNQSTDDMFISGTTAQFPQNNADACTVNSGPGTVYWDNTSPASGLGFNEHLRAFNLGDWNDVAYSAGNFTASGSMSWTVSSGEVATYRWTVIGHTMTVEWDISGSTIGGSAGVSLQIAVPGGFTAAKATANLCLVTDGGTTQFGYASIAAAATVIQIQNSAAAGNWTTGSNNAGSNGSITFSVD